MDQWLQKLSGAVILLTLAATLHSTYLGATCWCPAVFSESHVHYTDTWCSKNGSRRHPLPPPSQNSADISSSNSFDQVSRVTLFGENTCLFKYLAGEFILVAALYSLVKCVVSSSSLDVIFSSNIHRSYSKAPLYVIVQLIGSFLWAAFAVLTFRAYSPGLLAKPEEPFLCDFEIYQLSRAHRYTVQCVDETETGMKMAVTTNIALCVVVAFCKLVHLVAIFGIQPLLKVDKVARNMAERKVIDNTHEVGLGFGLSDLYFAILVSERDVTSHMRTRPNKDGLISEKIPYGSRPVSMAF